MTFWKWSQTAATNGTADSTCLFPEGMAASALNDGTRGMMAAAAKYRDDMTGAIVTAGAVNAYTVASFEVYDTLAHLHNMAIAFSPHVTNTAAVLLSADGLGGKPLRPSPGVDFIGGELIQGTPYVALYNNTTGEFYVRGFMTSPYNVPLLAGLEFWDTIAPNSCFIFPTGQAISRTVYSKAFARWGTSYGAGDGSTTFNVPDKTGRVSAMKEAAATRLTATYFGGNSTVLGAVGGAENENVGLGHLPANITVNGTVTMNPGGSASNFLPYSDSGITTGQAFAPTGGSAIAPTDGNGWSKTNALSATPTFTANNTGSNAPGGAKNLVTVQPTIVCNYIIRII